MLPEELTVKNDREILKEVASELNLTLGHVERTFNVWLRYLRYISTETDQASITIPKIGTLIYSLSKAKPKSMTKSEKELRISKLKRITIDSDGNFSNCHRTTVPVHILYGMGRKNMKSEDMHYFSSDEIIDNQNFKFFEEDFKYANNQRLKRKILRNDS